MNDKKLENERKQLLAQRVAVKKETLRCGAIPRQSVNADDNDFADQVSVAVERDLNQMIVES